MLLRWQFWTLCCLTWIICQAVQESIDIVKSEVFAFRPALGTDVICLTTPVFVNAHDVAEEEYDGFSPVHPQVCQLWADWSCPNVEYLQMRKLRRRSSELASIAVLCLYLGKSSKQHTVYNILSIHIDIILMYTWALQFLLASCRLRSFHYFFLDLEKNRVLFIGSAVEFSASRVPFGSWCISVWSIFFLNLKTGHAKNNQKNT